MKRKDELEKKSVWPTHSLKESETLRERERDVHLRAHRHSCTCSHPNRRVCRIGVQERVCGRHSLPTDGGVCGLGGIEMERREESVFAK